MSSNGDKAVSVRGLGKAYTIQHDQPRHTTLAAALIGRLRSPFGRSARERFWALEDVNVEIRRGEAMGILGRNGAGKSTFLKILSRITRPTRGELDLHGRVASLLEVGTGFHQELTGRENVYLNGSILGMKRGEITRNFDDIVAFAEVEKFIDTPVKRYSTGMYMRLAFAVAAHLESEILVVDEVLAVGDMAFQRKCLGKMGEIANQGRTVLMVSHNLGAITQLCRKAMLLRKGKLIYSGDVQAAAQIYLSEADEPARAICSFSPDLLKPFQILEAAVLDSTNTVRDQFDLNDPIRLGIRYAVHAPLESTQIWVFLSRNGSPLLCAIDTDTFRSRLEKREPGIYRYDVAIPPRFLKGGNYTVTIATNKIIQGNYERHRDVISFRVDELSEDVTFAGHSQEREGVVISPLVWQEVPDSQISLG